MRRTKRRAGRIQPDLKKESFVSSRERGLSALAQEW